MSTELSLDVDSDISSRLEQITSDDDIDQKDMNHIVCDVPQSDDDLMLITSLMWLLFLHRHPFLERIYFKISWLVVRCIVHSTWSMDIINCSCERVIFPLQQWALRVVCYGNGWWCLKGCLMPRLHLIVSWCKFSAHIGNTHRRTLMTFLSIVVPIRSVRCWQSHRSFASRVRVHAH